MPIEINNIATGLRSITLPNVEGTLLMYPYSCSNLEFIKTYKSMNIVGLYVDKYTGSNLVLESRLPKVLQDIGEDVKYLYTSEVSNFHFFYCCKNLKYLWLEDFFQFTKLNKEPINLYEFPKLLFLRANTLKGDQVKGINSSSIEHLKSSVHFISSNNWSIPTLKILELSRSKENNLNFLSGFPNVKSLYLFYPEIESVDGIKRAGSLKYLHISYSKKLNDISALADTKLTNLEIQNSANIQNFEKLFEAKELQFLTLYKCGKINSINKLIGLKSLHSLNLYNTTIVDGDLSVLTKRKWQNISFRDESHYSHTLEEIREHSKF